MRSRKAKEKPRFRKNRWGVSGDEFRKGLLARPGDS